MTTKTKPKAPVAQDVAPVAQDVAPDVAPVAQDVAQTGFILSNTQRDLFSECASTSGLGDRAKVTYAAKVRAFYDAIGGAAGVAKLPRSAGKGSAQPADWQEMSLAWAHDYLTAEEKVIWLSDKPEHKKAATLLRQKSTEALKRFLNALDAIGTERARNTALDVIGNYLDKAFQALHNQHSKGEDAVIEPPRAKAAMLSIHRAQQELGLKLSTPNKK